MVTTSFVHPQVCRKKKMAYTRRYQYRKNAGWRRSYKPYRRTYRKRFRRRRSYRRRSSTKSAYIRLSWETAFRIGERSTTSDPWSWLPVYFQTYQIPGFLDYAATYTHFRIVKCVLNLSRVPDYGQAVPSAMNPAPLTHFLTVPSRAFATTSGAWESGQSPGVYDFVPAQAEDALRQTKWQREIRPSDIRPWIRVGFKPYTMIGGQGPANTTGSIASTYFRIWEARRWMPMSWAHPVTGGDVKLGQSAFFFGPYIATSLNFNDSDPTTGTTGARFLALNATVVLTLQFRGQK